MSTLNISLAPLNRVVFVLLFLPFSAAAATVLILVGLFVELFMSAGVVSGIADRACAFILAGYAVTAVVWKQFWRPGDFWSSSDARALSSSGLMPRRSRSFSPTRRFESHPYRLTQELAVSTESSPIVPYWHIWTDADGISHQSRCELAEFHKAPIQPTAAPQWIGAQTRNNARVFVTVLPVGWVGGWHENPRPQWIIPLSGRWFVESMDGVRVEMGPGEMSFGEDQNTHLVDGKQGHLSGTVGPEPAVLMLVQFEMLPTVASACRFR